METLARRWARNCRTFKTAGGKPSLVRWSLFKRFHFAKESPKHVVRNEYFLTVIRVPTWEIARKCSEMLDPGWIYRGQSDESWNLSSTIERSSRRQGFDMPRLLHTTENFILEQFIRRAHHFLPNPPRSENKLEWLALIQHYGGPTRLLDFTHSFYVAAYFALENSTSDCAVWAANSALFDSHFKDIAHIDTNIHPLAFKKLLESTMNDIIGERAMIKCVLPVEPNRSNERLSAQQGLFLTHTDISSSFIDNITGSFDVSPSRFDAPEIKELKSSDDLLMPSMLGVLIKIIIPAECRDYALTDLEHMNINAATLFPGLDGFARSLHRHLRWLRTSPESRYRVWDVDEDGNIGPGSRERRDAV